ncbi:KGK domain-containing protein [Nostoc sp.]
MSVKEFGLDPDDRFGLSEEDAVSIQNKYFGVDRMVKVGGLISALRQWANSHSQNNEGHWFIEQGCQCQILRVKGGGWLKGRFRIRLEFIPDNPEDFLQQSAPKEEKPQSPLDDLRSQLNPE